MVTYFHNPHWTDELYCHRGLENATINSTDSFNYDAHLHIYEEANGMYKIAKTHYLGKNVPISFLVDLHRCVFPKV